MANAKRGWVFVPVENTGKSPAASKRLIRSHSMQGKNLRIGMQPRTPYYFAPTSLAQHHPAYPEQGAPDITQRDTQALNTAYNDRPKAISEDNETSRSTLICTSPSHLSLVRFAFDVDYESRRLISHYLDMREIAIYPPALPIDWSSTASLWVQWLFFDPVYLQCALFGVSAAQDLPLKRPTSHATYVHLRKAIKALNCNLSSADKAVSLRDGVVLAVVTLTLFACRMGDHESARAHAAGLGQMVRLRRGIEAFRGNSKLRLKMSRVALLYEQDSGSKWLSSSPAGLDDPLDDGLQTQLPESYLSELCDGPLWDILRDMQSYVSFVQDGSTTKDRRPEDEFHTTFCSLQHRLLTLNSSLLDAASQSIRLALIAVLTTVFQFPGLRASFPYLTGQYQKRYPGVEGVGSGNMKRLVTWYLIVGIMAVAEADSGEEWMFERWREDVGVVSWEEARKRCKEVLWIDALHDGAGKTAFDRLQSRM